MEQETGICAIPFSNIPMKSPDASPMDFCVFGLLERELTNLSAEDTARAVALVQDSPTYRYVAEALGTSPTSVYRAVKRFENHQTFHRMPGSGRPRCTTLRDDCFMVMQVLRDRHVTAVEARNRLQQVRHVAVSENTARWRLHEVNLSSRNPATGPKLTAGHRGARLQFARRQQY